MDPCRCESSMWRFSQLQRQTQIAFHSHAPVPERGTAGIRSLSRSEHEWLGRWRNQTVSSLPSLLALQPRKRHKVFRLTVMLNNCPFTQSNLGAIHMKMFFLLLHGR